MSTFSLFIFLVCLNAYTDTQSIEVINSGLTKLKKDDMALVFFVTIKHFGSKPRRTMVTMVECCEKITEGDNDCDLIELFGGDFGVIQPGGMKNLTLIYPNLYGYNRRGYCLINVIHRDLDGHAEVGEIHHRMDFDTRLTPDAVPPILSGFYDPETFIPCESPDLDPLNHCHPVDCDLKYSGYRNFYNRKMKLCQRVPVCNTNQTKDLPDIVYSPNSNTCQNLEKAFTKEDFENIVNGKFEKKSDQLVNIRCHHGEIDPRTGLCICDYGWKSEPFDPDAMSNANSFYSMCTVRCVEEEPYKYLPFLVGLLLAIWLFFLITLCEWRGAFEKKCSRSRSPDKMYYAMLDRSSSGSSQMFGPGGRKT